MNHQFEMEYGSRQLKRLSQKLVDLNQRIGTADLEPLTRGESLDAVRVLSETIAEMRLVAHDLDEWSATPPRKKKFWQFWK